MVVSVAVLGFTNVAKTIREGEPRDALAVDVSSVLSDVRAVTVYDGAGVNALAATSAWSTAQPLPRPSASSAAFSASAANGVFDVVATEAGARVEMQMPIAQEAPAPGASPLATATP